MKVGVVSAERSNIEYLEVENDYRALQEVVGGLIEYIELSDTIGIYCNEEGKLLGLPPSLEICENGELHDIMAGPCIFVSTDTEGNNLDLAEFEVESIESALKPGKFQGNLRLDVKDL